MAALYDRPDVKQVAKNLWDSGCHLALDTLLTEGARRSDSFVKNWLAAHRNHAPKAQAVWRQMAAGPLVENVTERAPTR